MTELRWWLLILGVAFFAGLTWWELRRPRQARQREAPPEPTRPREPSLQLPEMHAVESLATRDHLPGIELADDTGTFPVLEAATPEAGSEEQGEMLTDAGGAPAHGEAHCRAGLPRVGVRAGHASAR